MFCDLFTLKREPNIHIYTLVSRVNDFGNLLMLPYLTLKLTYQVQQRRW